MAKRTWSSRARRDFREREEYRKRNDEKDRYEKRDSRDDRSEDAREDRREERGYWDSYDEYENTLMNIRNAGPDDSVDDQLDRMRESYRYIESELDRYDADYDYLMERYRRLADDNTKRMMRDAVDDAYEEGEVVDRQQNKDIKQDGEDLSYEDLWKTREG